MTDKAMELAKKIYELFDTSMGDTGYMATPEQVAVLLTEAYGALVEALQKCKAERDRLLERVNQLQDATTKLLERLRKHEPHCSMRGVDAPCNCPPGVEAERNRLAAEVERLKALLLAHTEQIAHHQEQEKRLREALEIWRRENRIHILRTRLAELEKEAT